MRKELKACPNYTLLKVIKTNESYANYYNFTLSLKDDTK